MKNLLILILTLSSLCASAQYTNQYLGSGKTVIKQQGWMYDSLGHAPAKDTLAPPSLFTSKPWLAVIDSTLWVWYSGHWRLASASGSGSGSGSASYLGSLHPSGYDSLLYYPAWNSSIIFTKGLKIAAGTGISISTAHSDSTLSYTISATATGNTIANQAGYQTSAMFNVMSGHIHDTLFLPGGGNIIKFPSFSADLINLSSSGPSAIGFGDASANPALALVASNGQWFPNALAGDNAVRNVFGRIIWGNNGSAFAGMYLDSNTLYIRKTPQIAALATGTTAPTTSGTTKMLIADANGKLSEKYGTGDYVNIMDYGADPTGATSSNTAWDAAQATGKHIYIPDGTFLITLRTLNDDQNVFGNGTTSILKNNGNNRCVTAGNRSKIYNLKFTGDGKGAGKTFQTGVFLYQKIGWEVTSCMFEGLSGTAQQNGGGGIYGESVATSESDGGRISNCYFYNNNGGCILSQRAEYITVSGCTFGSNTVAIGLGGGNITVNNNVIQSNTTGIYAYDGVNNAHNIVSNNLINHNTYPLDIRDVVHSVGYQFTNNMIYYGALKFTNADNIKFVGGNWGSIDSIYINNSHYLQRIGVFYGLTGLAAPIPVNKYLGGEDFSIIGEIRSASATPTDFLKQQAADTVTFKGPLFHKGFTGSSTARATDSAWVKTSTGQWALTKQATYNLVTNMTDVGNIGSGEDDLITYSLPAGQLAVTGDYVEGEMAFRFAVNGNSKTVKIYFGSDVLINTSSIAASGGDGLFRFKIVRTGAATQEIVYSFVSTNNSNVVNSVSGSQTLSGAITIKATGTAVADNDIIETSFTAKFVANQ